MGIDPTFITGVGDPSGACNWCTLGLLAKTLWINVLFALTISFNFIIAHAFIPSFVASGHLPREVGRIRPLFYAVAAGAFLGLILFVASRFELIKVAYDIYAKTWI